MLRKLTRKLAVASGDDANNHNYDMTILSNTQTVRRLIQEATNTCCAVREFANIHYGEKDFISLGENCSTAWYLKQAGIRNASFPFDWIFSSPEIILDCIQDGFEKFLDRSFIVESRDHKSAGHRFYHAALFNHRNPLASEVDYQYYVRCCQRFMEKLESDTPVIYLITLIAEPEKRKAWANGFLGKFKAPVNQSLADLQDLMLSIQDKNPNSQFIVIDQYTQRDPKISYQMVDESTLYIDFRAVGESSGVSFKDALDDFCFKLLLTGLC